MSRATRPLQGHSILVIDDDRLGAFQLQRALMAAGARVVSGDLATAEPYLGAAALAAVVVGTGLNASDAARLADGLARCTAPWVAYGDGDALAARAGGVRVARGDMPVLLAQLAALCSGPRH